MFKLKLGMGYITLHSQNPCDVIWYLDDKFHRENGPAFERINGNKHWYLNGIRLDSQNPCDVTWYLNVTGKMDLL